MGRVALTLIVLTTGCGDGVEASLSTTVRIDRLLADDVASMSIYVLGPRLSDDTFYSCDTLMSRALQPTDSKVDILARADIAFSEPEGYSATLTDVEPGENRFIYIDARDAGDAVIANGCTDRVTVESGRAVSVDVDVYAL